MNFEDIKVRINKPYPKITNATPDKTTVNVLKELTNSNISEASAVLNYLFQYTVADSYMSDIAEVLEEISIVEMTHMDMLMHAMTDFGGTPTYVDGNGKCFSTAEFAYPVKLKEMLDADILAEEQAVQNYRMAIKRVENQSLKDLFARIVEDELQHIEVLKTLRSNVNFLSI